MSFPYKTSFLLLSSKLSEDAVSSLLSFWSDDDDDDDNYNSKVTNSC